MPRRGITLTLTDYYLHRFILRNGCNNVLYSVLLLGLFGTLFLNEDDISPFLGVPAKLKAGRDIISGPRSEHWQQKGRRENLSGLDRSASACSTYDALCFLLSRKAIRRPFAGNAGDFAPPQIGKCLDE